VSTQANLQPAPLPSTAASLQPPVQAPIPRKMSLLQGQGVPRPGIGTPRPGSRPSGAGGTGGGAPRLTPTVPRPGSAVPKPTTITAAAVKQQTQGPPVRTGTPMDVDSPSLHRGKKREREDGMNGVVHANPNAYATANGAGVNGGYVNGTVAAATNVVPPQHQQQPQQPIRPGVVNAKAGAGNIHPRPVKKQRMVC